VKKLIQSIALLLLICMFFSSAGMCFAANGGSPVLVSDEMTDYKYWAKKGSDRLLIPNDRILGINEIIKSSPGTHMVDFDSFDGYYDANKLRLELANGISMPAKDLYINGKKIDKASYYNRLKLAVKYTGLFFTETSPLYTVACAQADIKSIPSADHIGYSKTDMDDEMQLSSLLVNEPFIAVQRCSFKGHDFYYGHSDNVSGWVEADKLAICSSKEEWLNAWYVDPSQSDFIVVCEDMIKLGNALHYDYASGLELYMGSILKLVEKENIPKSITGKGSWFSHAVYIPQRGEDGKYIKSMALIPVNANVSTGFLPYTEENILKLSFSCLGNRYGWGNMTGLLDCSGFVRNILRCFGFKMPRNTSWQQCINGANIELEGKSDEEKLEILKNIPKGSLLYFSGHAMIYVGFDNKMPYVISSVLSLSDSKEAGALDIQQQYGVLLTPLSSRRASQHTWLNDIKTAVVLQNLR